MIIKDDGARARQLEAARAGADRQRQGVVPRGFGVTPAALAVAPLATEAKIPLVVTAAGTSIITERSPYAVRTSFTLAQSSTIIADWAAKNGIKKVVTMVSRLRARRGRRERRSRSSSPRTAGRSTETHPLPARRIPTSRRSCSVRATPSPTRSSSSCPRARAATFVKQYVERGLDKAGIKLIGPGDVTDDDLVNGMGDQVHRHGHRALLLGGAPVADEQGLGRGIQEGEQRPAARTSWR